MNEPKFFYVESNDSCIEKASEILHEGLKSGVGILQLDRSDAMDGLCAGSLDWARSRTMSHQRPLLRSTLLDVIRVILTVTGCMPLDVT